jgi:type II secretory pathway pseudopilin PulG
MDNESKKTTTVSYAIIAIVAALALPGIVEITVGTIQQQQEAEAKGCRTSIAFNASQGRCCRP